MCVYVRRLMGHLGLDMSEVAAKIPVYICVCVCLYMYRCMCVCMYAV